MFLQAGSIKSSSMCWLFVELQAKQHQQLSLANADSSELDLGLLQAGVLLLQEWWWHTQARLA
jgi:hypothetical protein